KVTCVGCSAPVASVRADIYRGDVLRARDFDFVSGQEATAYERIACKRCGGKLEIAGRDGVRYRFGGFGLRPPDAEGD
ncbi:MAG: hypothetical protein ACRDK7_10705, partial [Solirubrobacteraceae bacterium]